jgi:UDP-N-acetylglucosamine--N-acetylmuramyl-(pentapeptide) pyrophosphoryl-undecaprenol N-acetylglucosamine transferase
MGISTLLHEQNVYPGLANRRLARKAQAVCLTFKEAETYFPHPERLYHTGLPVRQEILALAGKALLDEAYGYFNIPETERDIPILLITGGSQGAKSINQAALAAYKPLLGAGIRIIHLCGKNNYFEMRQKAPEHDRLLLLPYLDEMEYGLAVADLAVARAGASFLAEAAVFGLPAVLVPYPYATNDHQSGNAQVWADAEAARVIRDSALTGDALGDAVLSLLGNPVRLKRMKESALTLAKPRAEKDIADIAMSVAKK